MDSTNENEYVPVVFSGRKLLIATKHEKEQVIAPLFAEKLGALPVVVEGFNTDLLGTFTGEIPRSDDPLTTLRKKCHLALAQGGGDWVVASEGSFGPHPSLFGLPANDELMMCIDTMHQLEVVARTLTINTNFQGGWINDEQELMAFAERALFPSHALILRAHPEKPDGIVKGIQQAEELVKGWREIHARWGAVYAETDMRAMCNPGRMQVIAETAVKLVNKLLCCCPQCTFPGFDIVDVVYGLPCILCGTPTSTVLSRQWGCRRCGFVQTEEYPQQKITEDPMNCPVCNP